MIHFLFKKTLSVLFHDTDVTLMWRTQGYVENTAADFSAPHKLLGCA